MVVNLAGGLEYLAGAGCEVLSVAEDVGDDSTADVIAPRLTIYEKTAWMLRATAK